jgi:hypothetical protein
MRHLLCPSPLRPSPPPAILAALLLPALLLASPAAARAGSDDDDGAFVTLDRVGSDSRGGVDLSYLDLDDVRDSVDLLHFDFHGRHPFGHGFALAFHLPITRIVDDAGVGPLRFDTTDGVGNLGLDALLALRGGAAALFLRAGLVVPTTDLERTHHPLASLGRVTDLPASALGVPTLRLSASPQLDQGRLRLRSDLGLDLGHGGSDRDGDDRFPIWARVNVGARLALGALDVTAELTSVLVLGGAPAEGRPSLTTAALAVRLPDVVLQPHLALVLPVDGDARDALDVAITLGIQAPIDRW